MAATPLKLLSKVFDKKIENKKSLPFRMLFLFSLTDIH